MSKKRTFWILVLAIFFSLLIEILFGARLSALVATLPIVRKFNLFQPQAPIVINRRETVRVSDSNDIRDAVNSIQSKISVIVATKTGQPTFTAGAAINLTSDGLFLTSANVIQSTDIHYKVVLQDGRNADVQTVYADPATNLAIIKANISGVPVANIASSKDAVSGQRVIFVYNTLDGVSPAAYPNFVVFPQHQDSGPIYNSDSLTRGFGVQPMATLVKGEAVIDLSGNVLAMSDGSSVISSDVMRQAYQQILARASAIIRPSYGFLYRVTGKAAADLVSGQQGIEVVQVLASGPAHAAGLQTGDVITKFNDNQIDDNTVFEELLEGVKPGSAIKLSVMRGTQSLDLTLTPTQQK